MGMGFGRYENLANSTKEEEEEILFIEILEKIWKPFEDLWLSVASIKEGQWASYISEQVIIALLSSDPVIQLWVPVDLKNIQNEGKTFMFQDLIILIHSEPKRSWLKHLES